MEHRSKDKACSTISLIDPHERLKHLINYSNAVEVDFNIRPTRYYQSGLEMVRQANVYYKEGSLENAYVLYLKFMTLFVEKIPKHPDFNTVPSRVKAINKAKLREVFPIAEKLKQELLQQYTEEYTRYIKDLKAKQERDKERKKSIEQKKPSNRPKANSTNFIDAATPFSIEGISYPDPNMPSAPPATAPSQPPDSTSDCSVPSVDRSTKPSDIFNNTYDKHDLRTVIIPSKVMSVFQMMAQKNTINNIETCGILAGKLEKNELFITHMILPKQKGTSDSCTTMNEEEIFDYQDQHNLLTIGWIHTHPTQTAFLSSVDLHTHCPYQLLMPEAIAIVCAPRYNETGFFVLTPDYGLKFIASCRQSGFHPHPTNPPLFTVAEHIKIDQEAPMEVLDLRS